MNKSEIEEISYNIKKAQPKLGFSIGQISKNMDQAFSQLTVTANQLSKNIQAALDRSKSNKEG
ncbi:hypothetical protein [Acinetobacter soli]|uniref:hypothetical protein n=1 Tax=Acinetobacter soli TaxID=487316 RepID=UPI0012501866|nr:hypothetical protein [Acinetobacter soli]